MSRPIHFEISANDPEKVIPFYRNVFGWQINKWDGPTDYWLIKTGEDGQRGIDGAIFNSGGMFSGTVNTIGVENLDQAIAKVKANGGQVLGEPQAIPGVGQFVYCKDVEGAMFGLIQPEPGTGQ